MVRVGSDEGQDRPKWWLCNLLAPADVSIPKLHRPWPEILSHIDIAGYIRLLAGYIRDKCSPVLVGDTEYFREESSLCCHLGSFYSSFVGIP